MIYINVSILFTYFSKNWPVNTNATFEVWSVISSIWTEPLVGRYFELCNKMWYKQQAVCV